MNFDQILVSACLLGIVAGLAATRLRPVFLFSGALSTLYLFDTIRLDAALKHFGNEALATLVLLVLLVIAIEKTHLFTRLGHGIVNGGYRRALAKLTFSAGFASAFSNNTAVVAALMGALRNQASHAPSRMLIPLSYASIWGGTLTLVGTSTNLLLNGLVLDAGLPALEMFDFATVGVPVFLVCGGLLLLIAPKLLPERPFDSEESKTYFLEARVQDDSPLIGKSLKENGFRNLNELFLVEIIRRRHIISPVAPDEVIEAEDVLIFAGDIENVQTLKQFKGLTIFDDDQLALGKNLIEVVITPTATVTGRRIRDVNFRSMFDAAVVAVRRGDQRLAGGLGSIKLQAGDNLVLARGPDFDSRKNLSRNFVVMGGVDTREHLSTPVEYLLLIAFAAVIGLAAAKVLPLVKGLLILMAALLATRLITINEIRRRFPFELVLVIGCALGIAQAMQDSGVAGMLAQLLIDGGGSHSVYAALVACFFLTLLLTELVTNNAAATLVFPIAIDLANRYQSDAMPFIMAVAFGASASFLSPYGYQTNLMVYSAGKYHLLDYLKAGLPISVTYSAVVLIMIPYAYPFFP